jgi:hypothetical protein
MGFLLTYKALFEVKILHHFFLNKADAATNTEKVFDNMPLADKTEVLKGYDVRNFIRIEPTATTAAILRKHHCIYKNTATGILVGLQSKSSGGQSFPDFSFADDLHFTFNLYFDDVYFTNYTALPLVRKNNFCYFLQNRNAGSDKKYPSLTQFPDAFAAGTFSSGDIISDNAANPTQLFMANKITTAAAPGADWINDPLVGGNPLHYLTKKDLLRVYSDRLRFNTEQTGELNLTITVKDRWGNTVTPKFETTTENDKVIVLVDLHLLPEDLYTIKLEDLAKPYSEAFSFFHLQNDTGPDVIVDLSIKSEDAAYNMTDGAGALLEPVYELRFRNRYAQWRYLGEKFSNKPETGPYPLTRLGLIDVTVNDANGDPVEDLPNPNIRMIKTEHPVNDSNHYNVVSEIYIH